MRITWTSTLCAVLVSAACADIAGPGLLIDEDGSPDTRLTRDAMVHAIDGANPDHTKNQVPETIVTYRSHAPELEQYTATIYAVQGEQTEFRLHYKNADGEKSPFLSVIIPRTARMLDRTGRFISAGDTVEIRVDVDPRMFQVSFDAGGVTMSDEAPITVVLDMQHANIGEKFLSQVKAMTDGYGAAWSLIPSGTTVGKHHVEFQTTLFSNYAVAW